MNPYRLTFKGYGIETPLTPTPINAILSLYKVRFTYGVSNMYNHIQKTVTCEECRTSIPVNAPSRRKAVYEVEDKGWLYSGVGMFWCSKCKERKKGN